MRNLIGLCKTCNEYKSNMIYYPGDYYCYSCVENGSLIMSMHRDVRKYIRKELESIDLRRYPLISPRNVAIVAPNLVRIKKYSSQFLFDIIYMDDDMRAAHSDKVNFLDKYAYYAVVKRSSQKIMSIQRIVYLDVDGKPYGADGRYMQLLMYDEWSDCADQILANILCVIGDMTANRYNSLGLQVDVSCVSSKNEKMINLVRNRARSAGFGYAGKNSMSGVGTGVVDDTDGLDATAFVVV